jgi:ribosomal protein S18 acetylase RimI-like enzyme
LRHASEFTAGRTRENHDANALDRLVSFRRTPVDFPAFKLTLHRSRKVAPVRVTGEVQLFVSVDNTERPMGFIAVEWQPTVGHIHGVVVAGGFQRQGVATQLLDHVEGLAQQMGITTLECITAETENIPALNCFTNWGFQNMGHAGTYPMGQSAVRLRCNLNAGG